MVCATAAMCLLISLFSGPKLDVSKPLNLPENKVVFLVDQPTNLFRQQAPSIRLIVRF